MAMKTIVTLEKLNSGDYYRAQVQLENKLVWAILYNAIYYKNRKVAAMLRDEMAPRIEEFLKRHAQTLIGVSDFGDYLRKWIDVHCDEEVKPIALKFIRSGFPEIKIENINQPQTTFNLK